MDFRDDEDRGDGKWSVLLMVLLLAVPILGAGGVLAVAAGSALMGGP